MYRSLKVLQGLQAQQGASSNALEAAKRCFSSAQYVFSSVLDAPPPAGSSAINLQVKPGSGPKPKVEVSASVGSASVRTALETSDLKKAASSALTLYDVSRVSVLHASLMEYLLRLAHERYSILSQWPDFTKVYGKDYFYRSHPDDVRSFYALVDEFHRMWDVVTEFDSLSHLATDLVPMVRAKRLNTLGPAVGPTPANAAVTSFLLA